MNTFESTGTVIKTVCQAAALVVLVTLMMGSASAQFVEYDPVDGLTGAVPASNTFDEDFFWDFKSANLSRAGFEDGNVYPYGVYPWFDPQLGGNEFNVTEHAGHDTALRAYWHSESGENHWELRGFSPAQDELWWSFDLYVPEVNPDDPDAPSFPDNRNTNISQIWHKGLGPMMVALKIRNNRLKVMNHGGPSINTVVGDIPRGEWNRVVLQVIPSLGDHGKLAVWYGGEKVAEKTGIRVASARAGVDDFTDDDRMVEGHYMLPWLGIYPQKPGERNGKADERTLFFDNIISYGGNKSVLRVEAENFQDYEDKSKENQPGFYRPDERVDIGLYMDDTGYEGYDWHSRHGDLRYYVDATTKALKQVQYDIEIPVAGTYRFHFRTASPDGNGAFAVSLENTNGESKKLGVIDVPETTREGPSPVERYRIGSKDRTPIPDTLKSRQDSFEWAFTTVSGTFEISEAGDYTVTLDVQESGFLLDWWEADYLE